MCDFGGPSGAEMNTMAKMEDYSNEMMSIARERLPQQDAALQNFGRELMAIQTGQTGPGMSGAERASRQSNILDQGAADIRNQIQAERERRAGVMLGDTSDRRAVAGGGDTSGLSREIATQSALEAGITAMGQARQSQQLQGLTAEDYALGRANAATALQGYGAQVGQYDPSKYFGAAEEGYQTQFKVEDQIRKEQIAASQAKIGMIEKGVMTAATAGAGGFAALGAGESFGEGLGDFASGAFNAVSGKDLFSIRGPGAPAPGGNGGGDYDI